MQIPRRLQTLLRQPLLALLAAVLLLTGSPVAAKSSLPKPHVSPALDAVLLPITAAVRKEFKLGEKAAGAVVVSVEPKGVAELYGLEPGDVITELNDKIIRRPVDIDSMIRYGLNDGRNFFFFEGTRKNRAKKTIIELYEEDYAKPVPIADLGRWRGYNTGGKRGVRGNGYRGDDGFFYVDGGFYYGDFCDVYYDDFYEVYDYTLIYVEQIIITEVYITSIESSDAVFYYDESVAGYDWPDDDYVSEVDDYVFSDEFNAAYSSEEVYYEDDNYDPETGLSYDDAAALGYMDDPSGYVDDGSGNVDDGSGYVDDGSGYVDDGSGNVDDGSGNVDDGSGNVDDGSGFVDDGSGYVEPAYEEPSAEETYVEESYVEEPAYEEPAYEEPVYEEPVYEEPAYDDGGGGCTYDEDGNEYC